MSNKFLIILCDIKTMCNNQEKICIFTGREPGEIRFGWEERWYGHPWDQIWRLSLFCPACGHWTLAHISDRKLQQTEGKFVTTTGKLNKVVNSFTRWKNQGTLWNCNFKYMQKPFLGRFVLYFFWGKWENVLWSRRPFCKPKVIWMMDSPSLALRGRSHMLLV